MYASPSISAVDRSTRSIVITSCVAAISRDDTPNDGADLNCSQASLVEGWRLLQRGVQRRVMFNPHRRTGLLHVVLNPVARRNRLLLVVFEGRDDITGGALLRVVIQITD